MIPANEHIRTQVQTWIHAAEGTFMVHGLAVLYTLWNFPAAFKESNADDFDKMIAAISVNVQKDFDWLETALGQSTGRFLVGDKVTAADIMMLFSVQFILARDLGTKGKSWAKVNEWVERCEATESYKKAVEKSGHTLYPKST